MNKNLNQYFEMNGRRLIFDIEKSILLCRANGADMTNLWAKKIEDVVSISAITEDDSKYYIACDYSDESGIFLAIMKESGSTNWYIPGKSFLQILFGGYLYLIFIDDEKSYFLIKVDRGRGNKVWHSRVDEDLSEYVFSGDRIYLKYHSGKNETLSVKSGMPI